MKGGRAKAQVMRQRKAPVDSVSGRAEDRGTARKPAGMVSHLGGTSPGMKVEGRESEE